MTRLEGYTNLHLKLDQHEIDLIQCLVRIFLYIGLQ